MLKRLLVQNYAIISEMELLMSENLTIITGETGAGKSILTGALGLIMGNRADTRVLFEEDRKCIVEGTFDLSNYSLQAFFTAHDLDYSDELNVRREINNAGKSRAFVNDTPVTLHVLQVLSEKLIDLHQQFDTGAIEDFTFQVKVLDAMAGNEALLQEYQEAFVLFNNIQRRLNALKAESISAAKEYDFLQYQYEELAEADIAPEEIEELDSKFGELSHQDEIKRAVATARGAISDSDFAAVNILRESLAALREVLDYKPELKDIHKRMDSCYVELDELGKDLDRVFDALEYEPGALDQIEERLNILNKLANKHHVTATSELIALRDDFEQRLSRISAFDERIREEEEQLLVVTEKIQQLADALSVRRGGVIAGLEQAVDRRLAKLAMENAVFKIQLEKAEAFGPAGQDKIDFLIATNKGSRLLPIGEIASGGELSRIALAIKSLVADSLEMPTLVFDEIDTGISGDVALKMGQILKELSVKHQVVCITHSPQIASKADKHYFVSKEDKGERTVAQLRELDEDGRIYALAVMLSSNPPSKSALENAKELIYH